MARRWRVTPPTTAPSAGAVPRRIMRGQREAGGWTVTRARVPPCAEVWQAGGNSPGCTSPDRRWPSPAGRFLRSCTLTPCPTRCPALPGFPAWPGGCAATGTRKRDTGSQLAGGSATTTTMRGWGLRSCSAMRSPVVASPDSGPRRSASSCRPGSIPKPAASGGTRTVPRSTHVPPGLDHCCTPASAGASKPRWSSCPDCVTATASSVTMCAPTGASNPASTPTTKVC